MTITATPDAAFRPPRVAVHVAIPVGGLMESVRVYRTVDGVSTDLRSQPVAGFQTGDVYDYEMDYETPITYGWETTYFTASLLSQMFAEAWTDLTAWTVNNGGGGSWAVSAGKLVRTYLDSTAELSHALTPGRYRITISSVPISLALLDFGGFTIDMNAGVLTDGFSSVAFQPGTTTWVIDVTPSAITLTTSAGSYSIASSATVSKVRIVGATARVQSLRTFGQTELANSGGSYSAVDSSGRLWVWDANGYLSVPGFERWRVYDATGTYLTAVTLPTGSGNGQVQAPRGFVFDPTGRMCIADLANNRIQRFTVGGTSTAPTLTYADKFGTSGAGNGNLNSPSYIAVDSAGAYYVGDTGNSRIEKFTSAGAYSTQWALVGGGNIKVDPSGNVWSTKTGNVYKWSNAGALLSTIPLPTGYTTATPQDVEFDANGDLLVLVRNTVFVYANGQWLYSTPTAYGAGFLAADAARSVLYTVSSKAVQQFTMSGSPSMGAISVQAYGVRSTLAEAAAPVTVAPLESWMVHPGNPGLSVPITNDADSGDAEIVDVGAVTNDPTATTHLIAGSAYPVVVTSGPRLEDAFTLTVETTTPEQDKAIKALLSDQTPLLIRVLDSWGYDLPAGFYAVGQPSRERAVQVAGYTSRLTQLPLQSVEAPEVSQQNVGWSWAQLAAEFPTWDAVKAAFATWADVKTNTRRA